MRGHGAWRDVILECVQAGIDVIDHGDPRDERCIEAMAQAGTTAAGPVRAALDGLQREVATGALTLGSDGYATMPMYVARATRDGLEVAQRFEAAAPGAACA